MEVFIFVNLDLEEIVDTRNHLGLNTDWYEGLENLIESDLDLPLDLLYYCLLFI